MLSNRCPLCPILSCPSVCDVCVLWPNCWMDQDGREVELGPGHIVLDGDPAPLPRKGHSSSTPFSAHVYCGKVVVNLSYY